MNTKVCKMLWNFANEKKTHTEKEKDTATTVAASRNSSTNKK